MAIAANTFDEAKAVACAKVVKELLMNLKPVNFDNVFDCDTPTLASLTKYRGFGYVKVIVMNEITKLSEFYTVGRTITDYQRKEASELIIETYPHWKLSDLKLLSRMAKRSQLGDTYDRFDGGVIMEWCKIYNNTRLEQSQSATQRNKAKMLSGGGLIDSGEETKQNATLIRKQTEIRLNQLKKLDSDMKELERRFFNIQPTKFPLEVEDGKGKKETVWVEREVRVYNEQDIKHILNLYFDVTNTEKATLKLFNFVDSKWRKSYELHKNEAHQPKGIKSVDDYLSFKCKQLRIAIQKLFNGDFVFKLLDSIVKEKEFTTPGELHEFLWSAKLDFGKMGIYKGMLIETKFLKKQASDMYHSLAERAIESSEELLVHGRIASKKNAINCIILRKLYAQTKACLLKGDEVWEFLDSV